MIDEDSESSPEIVAAIQGLIFNQILLDTTQKKALELTTHHNTLGLSEISPLGLNYGDAEYWENRYKSQCDVDPEMTAYEWLMDFEHLSEIGLMDWLCSCLSHESEVQSNVYSALRVLDLGCGNSRLSIELHKCGLGHVDSVDCSEFVVHKMEQVALQEGVSGDSLCWIVEDAKRLSSLNDRTYHAVIDKSTLDALLCKNSIENSATQMLRAVHRVLNFGGLYICISLHSWDRLQRIFLEDGLCEYEEAGLASEQGDSNERLYLNASFWNTKTRTSDSTKKMQWHITHLQIPNHHSSNIDSLDSKVDLSSLESKWHHIYLCRKLSID